MVERSVIHPLTAARWADLVGLFGPQRGASSGCWCMWPRLLRPEWNALGRDGRRDAFAALVEKGPPPGLLLYEGNEAIGWVAIAPRAATKRFEAMKRSAPAADAPVAGPVWAIACFYVRGDRRRRGLTRVLAQAALDHARAKGAAAVDACPVEGDRDLVWGDGFVGIVSTFRDLGFVEVARRSPRRPLMRHVFPPLAGPAAMG